MKQKPLWLTWLGLYIVCAGLGFIHEPVGLGKALLVLLALIFFVPPFILLAQKDEKTNRRLRLISLIWLIAMPAMMIINILSYTLSDAWGVVLNGILVILTSPMFCGQYWVVSIFLMACLFISAQTAIKKEKAG